MILTEAGSKRRASLYLVRGEAELAAHDPGGLEVLTATPAEFGAALTRENHTLKRALTDPHLLSGIGNAYSDEILHAAKMSPMLLTSKLTPEQIASLHAHTIGVLTKWRDDLDRRNRREVSRRRSPRFARGWRHTAATASRARCAARRFSAFSTRPTKPTTVRPARPAASCSPIAACRDC